MEDGDIRKKYIENGSPELATLVSDEDIKLIAKNIDIELLEYLKPDERKKVEDNDDEKHYFRYSILSVGSFPNSTPTLVFRRLLPKFFSAHTEYSVNLKTGNPTKASPSKHLYHQIYVNVLLKEQRIYCEYVKVINKKRIIPEITQRPLR
jgi:hypothetical protein